MGKTINVGGQHIELIDQSTISGDVAITPDGVTSIGDGKITTDMLSTAVKQVLYPVLIIGQGKIGYCQIG